jgi:hypothetical protein
VFLQAKLIIGAVALVAAAASGAWVAHKFYAADLATYKTLARESARSLNRQNAAVRTWVAEGKRLEAKVRAAEAKVPVIETRTVERIKIVHETQPAPGAPCVEVMAWFRVQYDSWALRWSSRP